MRPKISPEISLTLICQKIYIKNNKNFETDIIQCIDFCSRNVCKLAHISSNDLFAYLNLTF